MSNWPHLTGNSNVFRQSYVSGFLDVSGPCYLRQDITILGRLVVPTIVNNNVVNTSTYQLIVAEDISLNGRLYIGTGAGANFLHGNTYMLDISAGANQSGAVRIFEDKGTLPTPLTGSLILQHNDISGVSSILFPSKSALGLDYASIAYYETISGGLSNGSKYNYYGATRSTTTSALVLNVQRDNFNATDVSSIDSIILQATGSIILDACNNTLGQTIIQPRGGNVGIGKTFPQYPLDIHGIGNMSGMLLNDGSVAVSSMPQMDFSSNFATVWKAVGTSFPGSSLQYNGIALSATGQYQTAIIGNTVPSTTGAIYTSNNYGITWNQSTQTANWAGIAVSGNGEIQTAVVGGTGGVTSGSIYVSTNYGKTWAIRGTSQPWTAVAMSVNGVFQTATTKGGSIYISSDSGNTWTAVGPSLEWYCVSISANGQYQLAGIGGNTTATGRLYISSDYGATWLNINTGTTPGAINCHAVEVSATGQYMTAGAFNGYIYTSNNYGITWVQNTSAPIDYWHGLAMSSNGQYQAAVDNNAGYIYFSSNFGSTWTSTASVQAWRTVSMSADAKYLTACVVGGGLFSSVTPFPYLSSSNNLDVTGNVNIINPTTNNTGSIYMNGAVITTGNAVTINNTLTTSTINSTGSSSTFWVGSANNLLSTAISNPPTNNGIWSGTGDNATSTSFNLAIGSWFGTGFVDTCFKVCYIYFDHRAGKINATTFNAVSDYRIKDYVTNLDGNFTVDDLRPVSFYNKISKRADIGFIAHEVQKIFPQLVDGEKDGESYQSINYIGLIGLLTKEIQELKKKNSDLESKVDNILERLENAGL
jgi:hypothetical protein